LGIFPHLLFNSLNAPMHCNIIQKDVSQWLKAADLQRVGEVSSEQYSSEQCTAVLLYCSTASSG